MCCCVLCRIALCCVVVYYVVLCCIVLYCIALYCVVLYCVVLQCVVLCVVQESISNLPTIAFLSAVPRPLTSNHLSICEK